MFMSRRNTYIFIKNQETYSSQLKNFLADFPYIFYAFLNFV